MSDLMCVKTFGSRLEADLAKGVLAANGIEALVCADDAGGMRPDLAFTSGGVRLVVAGEDAKDALRVLGRDKDRRPENERDAV